MKKFLSIVLSILMIVTMLPIAIMPASAAYDYDETAKISFQITNLVREWKGETEELGKYGSAFYEQSLTKVADGKYKYTYEAALETGGGTWWSDPKTVTFDGVDCESDYYRTFDFTESTHAGGYTMTWTYTLEIKRSGSYGHLYSAWSDNGDGTHTRTCQINSTHVETLHHDWVAVTCVKAAHCETCGMVNGEPSSNAHNWGAWAPNGDSTHTRVCAWDNEHVEVEDCAYSDATCTALAKCSVCAGTTGDLNDKNHSGTTFTYEENSESLHNKYYACCGAFAKSEPHTFNLAGLCTVCSYQCMHASYTDSICDVCKNECPHSDVGDDGVCTDCGKRGILYIDRQWDAATKTLLKFNRFTPPEADIKVTSSTSSMSNGWYIVEGDVTIPSRITVTGTVHLILCDGAVLDAQKGITVSEGNTLCVYAQSDGSDTGKLIATGDGFKAGIGGDNEERNGGTVTINGGIVTATGGASTYNGAGIGGSYDGKGCTVTINGGVVTATGGGTDGAGIGGGESNIYKNSGCGGDVTINGGVVIAKGGRRAAGIGGGFKGNGGSVVITGGNVYAVDGDNEVNIGHGIGGKNSGSLKDADGNNVYLNTITLSDAADNTAVTELTGVTYGLTDVTTLDTNKLYFYLPSGAEATSITAGGVEYICNRNLTYYTEHEYKDATCITPQTCQYCGHTVGEATFSHNYVNGVCTVCGMGEADGIIYISTAEQLILFADYVNYVNKDADAVLMADIDLAEYTWTPIGVTAMGEGVTNGYTGSFDGNGYVIRNVTFATPTSAMAAGIFGTVQSGGTVRNLGVENITFDNNTYDHRAGGIAGQLLADSTISYCYVINSTVKASSRVVGGIVGMNNGTVKNCYTYNMTLAGYNNRFGGISGDFSAGKLENCYTDYSALASSQAGTATNCKAGVSADVFASGEITYLLNGSTSEGDLVWGQLIGTDSYPVFGGETVYYNESKGFYNILHTCDFSGEWKYDADKHWKGCTVDGCSETSEEAEHSYTNGKCVCGYACPHSSYTDGVCDKCDYECAHEWGEGVLTRPTFESEGYYTYTCTLCGHSYTEPTEEADTTALNDASMKVTEYIGNSTLTQEAANEIDKSYRDILKNNGNVFDEFGFVRGDLVEEDQPAINAVTEELQKIIDEAEEKIASGEYVKANYNGIYQAIHRIEDKFFYEGVTDEGQAGLEEIKKRFEAMKADENTSAADVAELEKEIEAYEEELDKGIEDGTLVMIRPEKIVAEFSDKWNEKLEAEGLLDERDDFINNQKFTDEALAAEKETIDFMDSLEGTVAENAENIAKLNEMLDSLLESFENCLRGTHNFNDYEVTSPAKCEVNAIETRTCWFCGETDEREVENSALTHSFTKYEETEAPKCGVAGKEVATCDNGCGATDEREAPALEHVFIDYASNGDATCTSDGTKTASCIYGCGATDTVADEGSKLPHVDEDGDKLCDDCGGEVVDICPDCGLRAHEDTGVPEYICLLITFIRLIVPLIKTVIAAM